MSFTSLPLKEDIKKYRTAQNFSRRLLNLSFDSVTIEAQKSNTKVIDDLNVQVTMTILLTGMRNERIYKDVRSIHLIKKGDIWLVDKLLAQ